MSRYGLSPGPVVVGVFGGSLGAGAINQAVAALAGRWDGPPIQILHLAGREHEDDMRVLSQQADVPWTVLGFEEEMQYFYAACDIVIARAGGAVHVGGGRGRVPKVQPHGVHRQRERERVAHARLEAAQR
ncbi:MAG: UDP-N-acetylglucosamine--N-acetylmuramyl-(pentapeptide) pyrophosphoryl-undecaprenol N-acetylglucosamine transferase, partial [bacterium]|nr:UDP-N-acetylglucosamine--N-acetylmuramyl-(pentapeptide) pyrophosphoryl-undecaprenol N-acetylglucosamine transferase [bacterium]